MEINRDQYNKIEDIMYFLGTNVVLKMNVSLYQSSEKYGRKSYHQEIQYFNEKIGDKVINLKRSFDYFATIENLKAVNHIKEYIMLRPHDIFFLRKVLNSTYDLFNKEFDNLFIKKNGIVTIRNKIKPIEMSDLSLGKYLVFTPDVMEQPNGSRHACIKMNLSSPNNFVYLTEQKLCGFLECINNMDMFAYSQNMINYLGRPELGTNLFDVSRQDIEDNVVAKKGRVIQTKQVGKPYFDRKMGELET